MMPSDEILSAIPFKGYRSRILGTHDGSDRFLPTLAVEYVILATSNDGRFRY